MSQTSVFCRCRPIRLGFLVRPGHRDDLLKAIEINTVLWGGMYNPLIPMYQRAPTVWKDKVVGGPTATEILRGYIETFQPDFLIRPAGARVPDGIFPKERTASTEDVLSLGNRQQSSSHSPIRFGVDILDVYRDAYRKVFRFVRRHPQRALIPCMHGRLSVFANFLWGILPSAHGLRDYAEHFRQVFDAGIEEFKSINTFLPGVVTPLRITSYKINADFATGKPCVFVLDEANPLDLIDFWNLRACGGECCPYPLSAEKDAHAEICEFMTHFLSKWAVNSEKLSYPEIVCSRSLAWDKCVQLVKKLPLSNENEIRLSYYPRLWAKQEVCWDTIKPAPLYSQSKTVKIIGEEAFSLEQIDPGFASEFAPHGPRWMNVVSLREYGSYRLPASVIPHELNRVDLALGIPRSYGAYASNEGIAICCEHKDFQLFLKVPEALRIAQQWASKNGYELTVSDKGHILESLVARSGGFHVSSWLADEGIIRILERMASGVVSIAEFRQKLQAAKEKNPLAIWSIEGHLRHLQDRGIVSLCMRVQCPHCRQHPYYALEEVKEELSCRHCLRDFKFPLSPSKGCWYYRSAGPFASKDFAQGAYAVFLALRLFSEPEDIQLTCIPSCIVARGQVKLEADFICFWHGHSWRESRQHTIFGECKSFGEFDEGDVRRMRRMAELFPGAVIAFCTLKSSLTPREKALLKSFSIRGRSSGKVFPWPTPVLVLTGNELCNASSNPFGHHLVGEPVQGLAARIPAGGASLLDVCSASQEEYLGLPSWHSMIEQYYRKKRRRRTSLSRP